MDVSTILQLRERVLQDGYEPTEEETRAALAYRREQREAATEKRAEKAKAKAAAAASLPTDLGELFG